MFWFDGANILYVASFPDKDGPTLDEAFFERGENRLTGFLPAAEKLCHVLRLIDLTAEDSRSLVLHADTVRQSVVCYRGPSS